MNLLKKYWPTLIGVVAGLAGGYLYYTEIGCKSGGCPITSNPWMTTIWGGVMGYLVGDMFVKKNTNDQKG